MYVTLDQKATYDAVHVDFVISENMHTPCAGFLDLVLTALTKSLAFNNTTLGFSSSSHGYFQEPHISIM